MIEENIFLCGDKPGVIKKKMSEKNAVAEIVSKPYKPCASSWGSNFEKVNLKDSIGRVSVEMVCPYPPGIPMVIPGEVLDERRVSWLIEQISLWPEQIPSQIRVVSRPS